jgi:hypothetical protein
VRDLCGLGEPGEAPLMAILDFLNDKIFLPKPTEGGAPPKPVCTGDVCVMPAAGGALDEAAVRAFVADWRAGRTDERSIGGDKSDDDE